MTRILTQTIALFVFFTHMASVQLVAEDGHPTIDLNRGWVALLKDKNLSGWQFLDSYGKASVGKHDCAAIYDMVAPSQNTARPPGQWNRITITAQGSHITVVLNSAKVVDVDLDDWSEPGKNPDGPPNKYKKPMKDAPRRGLIVLQEHPGDIWFRNIFIRSLE